MALFGKLFGGGTDKEIRKLQPLVDRIVALRPQMMELKRPSDVMRLARVQSKMYQVEHLTWRGALRDFTRQADRASGGRLFLNSVPSGP